MHPGMHTPSYEGTSHVVDPPSTHGSWYAHPLPQNPIKKGNPTSQCALLGLKLVQLSTLAGRIFFCHRGKSLDGVGTDYICTLDGVQVRTDSILTPCILHLNFVHCDKKKILSVSVFNWTNFKPNRAHWLVGFPILMGMGGKWCNNPGGVLVSLKCCKFKVLEGIG